MATDQRPSAVDVLLQLIELVPDVAQLERMIEPESLLRILSAQGQSPDEIRKALRTRLPGELLLELLRAGKRPEELLALCGPAAPKPVAAPEPAAPKKAPAAAPNPYAAPGDPFTAPAVAAPRFPPSDPFADGSTFNKVAGWALFFVVILPALVLAGFFPEWRVGTLGTWILIATLGAALCGAGFVRGRAPVYVGVLGGLAIAPGALFAIAWWTSNRTTVFRIEIALAFLIGALPGAFLYTWLFKRAVAPPSPPVA